MRETSAGTQSDAERGRNRIAVASLRKTFASTTVLRNVSVGVFAGEIVGLIGENGAGKSTLMDIMCGVQQPSSGEVLVDGCPTRLDTLLDGARSGIFRVFQEQSLISRLPVYVNLCLGAEAEFSVAGVFRRAAARQHARSLLTDLGLDYNVDRLVSEYSFGERQMLEIARSISLARIFRAASPVVLLDEPTAALSGAELEKFFELLGRLKGQGVGFVFVSHRLPELLEHCDRLYVLKDGAVVAEVGPGTPEGELHRLMVGRERAGDLYRKGRQREALGPVRLRLARLTAPGLAPTSVEVRAGEIVGVGGLLGSGKSQLAAAIFGAASAAHGEVELDGTPLRAGIDHRVRAGMGYIPLHRHAEGVSLGRSISDNMSDVVSGRRRAFAFRAKGEERRHADLWAERLRIRMRDIDQHVRTLSGGNQQKVVFAKWLRAESGVIIADNPTRGVDAGAKEEIYDLLRDLTDEGASVLLVSDDLMELIGLSNRILIMHDGEVTGEVQSPIATPASEETVVALMV